MEHPVWMARRLLPVLWSHADSCFPRFFFGTTIWKNAPEALKGAYLEQKGKRDPTRGDIGTQDSSSN